MKMLLGIAIGAAVGALLGYFGSCTSGACPLTANPFRGAIYGAVMGLLFSWIPTDPKKKVEPPPEPPSESSREARPSSKDEPGS
jgi:hypothetical protein